MHQCIACGFIGNFDSLHNSDYACTKCGEISKQHSIIGERVTVKTYPPKKKHL